MDVYSLPGYYSACRHLYWYHYHQPQTVSPANCYCTERPMWAYLIIMGLVVDGKERGPDR